MCNRLFFIIKQIKTRITNNIFNIYWGYKLHMSYKKVVLFLIYNLFYEFFMNFYFLSEKNIYVCAIDYNLFQIIEMYYLKNQK